MREWQTVQWLEQERPFLGKTVCCMLSSEGQDSLKEFLYYEKQALTSVHTHIKIVYCIDLTSSEHIRAQLKDCNLRQVLLAGRPVLSMLWGHTTGPQCTYILRLFCLLEEAGLVQCPCFEDTNNQPASFGAFGFRSNFFSGTKLFIIDIQKDLIEKSKTIKC